MLKTVKQIRRPPIDLVKLKSFSEEESREACLQKSFLQWRTEEYIGEFDGGR
jgi:hypothetical protein